VPGIIIRNRLIWIIRNMELSSGESKLSDQTLDTLIDSRRYTPFDLQGQYEDPTTKLPPLDSLAPGSAFFSKERDTQKMVPEIQKELFTKSEEPNHEWFDLPTQKTFERFTIRWDLWLYFVFYIIVLLLALLFFTNLSTSKFFQELNYPNWAPTGWVLLLIWGAVFITSMFSLWSLSSHKHANFYVLLILMNLVLLMLFIIAIWFTNVIILGTIVMGIAVLYSIFVCVAMARDSMTAMGLQIPYILFLILLFVISIQMSHNND